MLVAARALPLLLADTGGRARPEGALGLPSPRHGARFDAAIPPPPPSRTRAPPRQIRARGRPRPGLAERPEPGQQQLEERLGVDLRRDPRVRLSAGAAPQVDDGAAAAELRLGLDLDVEARGLEQVGPDHLRHRYRVVDRRPALVVDAIVERAVEVEQLGDDAWNPSARA